MQFVVPKFIEREARIAGPLTFKQVIIVGIAAAICFILYRTVPFFTFLIASLFLIPASLALAFLKIGGRPLLLIVANAVSFLFSSKIFIWKKRATSVILQKMEIKKGGEELPLKVVERSQLKRLKTKVETKAK